LQQCCKRLRGLAIRALPRAGLDARGRVDHMARIHTPQKRCPGLQSVRWTNSQNAHGI
jgi:hypothetical protein